MKLKLKEGTTGKLLRIFVQDSSQSDGRGRTGLAFNTAGLLWRFIREGDAAPTNVATVNMTVGTWVSGGFKEVSAADMPGIYEIGVPNAALAAGADSVVMMLHGASNMAPVPIEIEMDAVDYQDSATFGLSRLDAAVSSRLATAGYTAPDNAGIVAIDGRLPANPAAAGDPMTLDLTQAVPTANTAQTVGDSLNAARAQGFGKWTLVGTTLTLFAPDGTTPVRTFTLDNALNPTQRA